MTRRLSPALIGAALVALAGAGAGRAQIATAEDCARAATPAEEVTCLRQALEQSRAALSGRRSAKPKADAKPARAEAKAAIAPAAPAPPPPRQVARAVAPPPRTAGQLGSEQIVAPRRVAAASHAERERVRATVAAVDSDPRGVLRVRLDNGQTWQQADITSIPVQIDRGRPYAVEISRSGFGGYRMKFTEIGREITVKRVS